MLINIIQRLRKSSSIASSTKIWMLKGGTIIIKKGWSRKSFKRKCVTISNNVLHKQRRRQCRNPKGSCTKKPTRDPFRGKTGFTSKSLKKARSKRHLPESTGVPESILKIWASQRQGLLAEKPPFGGTWFDDDQISLKQSKDPRMIAADLSIFNFLLRITIRSRLFLTSR